MVARVLQALGIIVFGLTALMAVAGWLGGTPFLMSVYVLIGGLFSSVSFFFAMAVLDHLKAIRNALERQPPEIYYVEQEHEVEHYSNREGYLRPGAPHAVSYGTTVPQWNPRQADWS